MKLSEKTGALCAIVAALPILIASVLVLSEIYSSYTSQAARQIESGARAAVSLYEKRLVEMRAAAQGLADEIAAVALVGGENQEQAAAAARLQDILRRAQDAYSLDLVVVADPQGQVRARHNGRPAAGETLLAPDDKHLLADLVLSGDGQTVASGIIERGARYAQLELGAIVSAGSTEGAAGEQALMVEAASPILNGNRVVGCVLIGQMLNTYFMPRPGAGSSFPSSLRAPLVAEVRQSLELGANEDGGALIALADKVVASSIPPARGAQEGRQLPPLVGSSRGTRSGRETLREGNREYTVAWQPIKSLFGAELGAIGVAQATDSISGPSKSARATFFMVGLITVLVAAAGGFLFGRSLGVRINDLTDATARWSLGDLSATARDRDPMMSRWAPSFMTRDELSRLAEQMEELRQSFRQAIERLRRR
jgi:HAMP domain-containing protein